MSTFAVSDFDSANYDAFRPKYPVAFLENVLAYAQAHAKTNGSLRIVDVGTGPGTTIKTLVPLLPDVRIELVLTDISAPMLQQAKASLTKLPSNITLTLVQCSGEELGDKVEGNVDIVLAAECVHWINYDVLLANCSKLLRSGGTFAYWIYVDPVFMGNAAAVTMNRWYDDFVYESPETLGSYWDQPGRGLLRKLLRTYHQKLLAHEGNGWNDVCVGYLVNNEFEGHGPREWCKNLLIIEHEATLKAFGAYVDTWSSSYKWNKSHEKRASQMFLEGLKARTGASPDDTVKWQLQSSFAFASKQ